MYNETLIERNLYPENRGEIPHITPIKLQNTNCGDELEIYLEIQNNIIIDGKFSGKGCAISQASADLFIAIIIGKTVAEAKQMKKDFSAMILDNSHKNYEHLGVANALSIVSRMPARAKCAKLPWESLDRL